jgi:hypothetical protein
MKPKPAPAAGRVLFANRAILHSVSVLQLHYRWSKKLIYSFGMPIVFVKNV